MRLVNKSLASEGLASISLATAISECMFCQCEVIRVYQM